MPPKSILKKTASPVIQDNTAVVKSSPVPNEHHRQIAVHHANLLQQRKDVEAANLAAIEELMQFPTDPDADPVHPESSDLQRFQRLVQPFQPSDYNELFTERNCLNKCGYVFCPRAKRQHQDMGRIHIELGSKGQGPRFLLTREVTAWCSDQCARRALFIKVQLNERPAWERVDDYTKPIELLNEDRARTLEDRLGSLSIGDSVDDMKLAKAMEELALERGEKNSSNKPTTVMTEDIREKDSPSSVQAPQVNSYVQNVIEGYKSKTNALRTG